MTTESKLLINRVRVAELAINVALNKEQACKVLMRRISELKSMQLTKSEINHVLSLIESNHRSGEYTAPKEQYWKRSNRIRAKINAMLEKTGGRNEI